MSFFDTLKQYGLWPAQQANTTSEAYGLTPEMVRDARMRSLSNIGAQIMSASMPMTQGQRAQMMSNADWTGGYNSNLYNAAQMQLMAGAQKRKSEEQARMEEARATLAQNIAQLPEGRERNAAMFFLEAGDLNKAAEIIFGDQKPAAPPEMKTFRVGDKDVTYQWDQTQGQWVPFSTGEAFKPEAPAQPDPSKRLPFTKDYENAPEVQAYNTLVGTLGSLSKAVYDNSKISDLDFIYGVAKALDPTSVVRESEGQMVIDAQGLAPSLLGTLNGMLGGGQMTPEARKQLFALVERRAREYGKLAATKRENVLITGDGVIDDTMLRPLPQIPYIEPVPTDGRGDRLPQYTPDVQDDLTRYGGQ